MFLKRFQSVTNPVLNFTRANRLITERNLMAIQTMQLPHSSTITQPILPVASRQFATDPEKPDGDTPSSSGLVTKSFLKAKSNKQQSAAKSPQRRTAAAKKQTNLKSTSKIEEYKWNIQQRRHKRVTIPVEQLTALEKQYNVFDSKFKNNMKRNFKMQTGDYAGLKRALGRSKDSQGMDGNSFLIQKWSDPIQNLQNELAEVGASSAQGKKIQEEITALKAKQKEEQAAHQKRIDAYKKKGGDMKKLIERYNKGEQVYTHEEAELLPLSSTNIPSYIREHFREAHKKAQQQALKEAQKDPLLEDLIEQLKQSVASGKPVTMQEIDELVEASRNLDLAGDNRANKQIYSPQDLGNDEGLQYMLQRRAQAIGQQIESSSASIDQSRKKFQKEKLKNLTAAKYKQLTQQTRSYLVEKFPKSYEKIEKRLKLDENSAYQALVCDIFLNTRQESVSAKGGKKTGSCLLLDRLVSLLIRLEGQEQQPKNYALTELVSVYATTSEVENKVLDLLKGLEEQDDFMLKFQIVQIAKQHNMFGQVDEYMRQFARVCVDLPDDGLVANKLEKLLNTEVAIRASSDPASIDQAQQDYETVDPGVIAQPDFKYLTVAEKMDRIDEYHKLKQQLKTTKQLREMINNADGPTQSRLISSQAELESILDQVTRDSVLGKSANLDEIPEFQRLKKTQFTLNEIVGDMFREGYGIDGVTVDNMDMVYDPQVSGIGSLSRRKQQLVSQGMTLATADNLLQRYLNKNAQSGCIVSLMELFSSQKAKTALNNADLSKDVCLNFASQMPSIPLYGQAQAEDLISASRLKPIRPVMGQMQVRLFSTDPKEAAEPQQEEPKTMKSRFFAFLQRAEDIDKKVEQKDEKLNFEIEEGDISFEKSGLQAGDKSEQQAQKSVTPADVLSKSEQAKLHDENFKAIQAAKKRYDREFFKQFAQTGPHAEFMTQKALESFLADQRPEDLGEIVLSMVTSAYEINDLIPNIEMMFFKIFCSPITTKQVRKEQDKDDLLAGNLFASNSVELPAEAYKSLLQTVALLPKKKHFKKIIDHLIRYKQPEQVDSQLIDMINYIGIEQQYPILLGQTIKYMLQNKYKVSPDTFKSLVMFLERCKGFEEDAKKFVILSTETETIQVNYKMLRPLFMRTLKNKSKNDLLQLFEQLRKNIKLNKSAAKLPEEQKAQKLQELKQEFYDGLISDLLKGKNHQVAQIVYGEKKRDKLDLKIEDHYIGLEIFGAQQMMQEFKEVYQALTEETSEFKLNQKTCEELIRTLTYFESDPALKPQMIEMVENVHNLITDKKIFISGQNFNNLIKIYTESQQWSKINSLLISSNEDNCAPERQIVGFLKKNIIFCFDSSMRGVLKESVDQFDNRFFSLEARRQKRDQGFKGNVAIDQEIQAPAQTKSMEM